MVYARPALTPRLLSNDTPLIRASRTFSRREKDLDENDVAPTPPPRSLSLRERVWSLDTIESSEGRQNEGMRGEGLNGEGDRRFVAELETEVGEEVQDRGTGRVFAPLGERDVGLVARGARLENGGQQDQAVASDLERRMS